MEADQFDVIGEDHDGEVGAHKIVRVDQGLTSSYSNTFSGISNSPRILKRCWRCEWCRLRLVKAKLRPCFGTLPSMALRFRTVAVMQNRVQKRHGLYGKRGTTTLRRLLKV